MTTTKTTTSTHLTLEQIINFDPPGEDNKHRFRYTNSNNEHQELYLSPCAGRNLAEVLLYAHNALELFEPINFDTGEARFTLFRMALSGAASVAWRKVYADIPDGADLDWDRFHLTVTQWVDKLSMEEDQTELLTYLRSKLHKPRSLDCQQVLYALTMANEMAALLPGVEEPLNEASLKQAYYDLMPRLGINNLSPLATPSAVRKLRSSVPISLCRCALLPSRKTSITSAIVQLALTAHHNNNNNNNNHRQCGNCQHGHRPHDNNNNNNEHNVCPCTQLQASDPCPNHPNSNRTWGACFQNPVNANAGPNNGNQQHGRSNNHSNHGANRNGNISPY
jgi:hypothetical protein